MKLPEDKKERNQILVLIGIGVLVLIFGVYQGIVFLKGKNKEADERIEELKSSLKKASSKIERMRSDREKNLRVLRSILELTDNYVLEPHLGGNYMLEAKSIINADFEKIGLELSAPLLEKGTSKLQGTSGTFNAYEAQVSMKCSYFDLLKAIRQLKKSNPLVAITELSISPGKDNDYETHDITFRVQWPIWRDSRREEKLKNQLESQQQEKKQSDKPTSEEDDNEL